MENVKLSVCVCVCVWGGGGGGGGDVYDLTRNQDSWYHLYSAKLSGLTITRHNAMCQQQICGCGQSFLLTLACLHYPCILP